MRSYRASLEFLRVTGSQPDILHVHEWQTAAVPMLFWEHYHKHGLERARLVFTIHNLDSQGECRQEEFAATGMSLGAYQSLVKYVTCPLVYAFAVLAEHHNPEPNFSIIKLKSIDREVKSRIKLESDRTCEA